MQQSKVPPPSLHALIGVGLFGFGLVVARIRGGADNTVATLLEGLGLVGGLLVLIFAGLCHFFPKEVAEYLRDDAPPPPPPRPTYEATPQPKKKTASDAFEGLDFLGPWTPVGVFAVVTAILMIGSNTLMVNPDLKVFASIVSLLPVAVAAIATYSYVWEDYDGAAKWLMRAGMLAAGIFCILGICVYAEVQIAALNKNIAPLLNGGR